MFTQHQYPQFFTSTCLEWKYLLANDNYKKIIIEDLKWLVNHHWIKIYCFVIMPNHLHYIWHVHPSLIYQKVKGSHLRNTAQKIKNDLIVNNEQKILDQFYVGAKDRAYQFWERNPLSTDLYSPHVIQQKMNYIHANPIRKNLCQAAEDYIYSSAEYYKSGQDQFGILTHIGEIGTWNEDPILVKSKYFGSDAS